MGSLPVLRGHISVIDKWTMGRRHDAVARPLRIELSIARRHVMPRGNERRTIFVDEADRRQQWLNVSYSVWLNRRHRRSGHLFQGRFKSMLVDEGTWPEVARYVHLNPVRVAGLSLGKPFVKRGGDVTPLTDAAMACRARSPRIVISPVAPAGGAPFPPSPRLAIPCPRTPGPHRGGSPLPDTPRRRW